jgi:hypothetical protein
VLRVGRKAFVVPTAQFDMKFDILDARPTPQ